MSPEETARRMIDAERTAQNEMGRDGNVDDFNTPADWAFQIAGRINQARIAADEGNMTEYRRRAVQVAAMALAQVESIVRPFIHKGDEIDVNLQS